MYSTKEQKIGTSKIFFTSHANRRFISSLFFCSWTPPPHSINEVSYFQHHTQMSGSLLGFSDNHTLLNYSAHFLTHKMLTDKMNTIIFLTCTFAIAHPISTAPHYQLLICPRPSVTSPKTWRSVRLRLPWLQQSWCLFNGSALINDAKLVSHCMMITVVGHEKKGY